MIGCHELYFLVASHHLASGYVDQPPLAVLMARTTDIFGVNPTAIRIIPALAGATIVVVAARIAALSGASPAGRVRAALAMGTAPPDQAKSDWNDIAIGVCAGPSASWRTLWPHLKHYD
jgi:hypothetical protein